MFLKINSQHSRCIIYVNKYIFISQNKLRSPYNNLSDRLYTYLYVIYISDRFGFSNIRFK
jgi:hypothetical protein